MAITYVGASSASGTATGDLTPHASVAEDDILIINYAASAGDGTLTTPSGFTAIEAGESDTTGNLQCTGSTWWKRAGASEGATSIPSGSVDHWVAQMYVIRGCATSVTPIADSNIITRTATSGAFTPLAEVTSTADDQFVIYCVAMGDNKAMGNWADSDLTTPAEIPEALTNLGTDGTAGAAYGWIDTSGTTVGDQATVEANASMVVSSIILREEPAGTTFNQTITTSVSKTPSVVKKTEKSFAVAVTKTPSVATVSSFVQAINTAVTKSVALTTSITFAQTLTTAVTKTVALTKLTKKSFSVGVNKSVALVRSTKKSFTIAVTKTVTPAQSLTIAQSISTSVTKTVAASQSFMAGVPSTLKALIKRIQIGLGIGL